MKQSVLREFARRGWPVVLRDTGTVPDIVYPYVREIKVVYASPEEFLGGAPRERVVVVLVDKCGHSLTECLPRQLSVPMEDAFLRIVGRDRISTEDWDIFIKLMLEEQGG